jgi:hypothetical protein
MPLFLPPSEEKRIWRQKALDSDDIFVKGKYHYEKNRDFKYLRQACEEGHILAIGLFTDLGYNNSTFEITKKGAQLGDPECQYILACTQQDKSKRFKLLLSSALQDHYEASECLIECYFEGIGCSVDIVKGAKMLVKIGNINKIEKRLKNGGLTLKEFYIYGRHLKKRKSWQMPSKYPIEVFEKSTFASKQAVLCFMWCTKELIHRDVRIIIGKMIWKFRKNPGVWGI